MVNFKPGESAFTLNIEVFHIFQILMNLVLKRVILVKGNYGSEYVTGCLKPVGRNR